MNDQGELCSKDHEIEKAFVDYFNLIYSDPRREQFFIDNLDWAPISATSNSLPDRPFDELEIWQALKSFKNNKATVSLWNFWKKLENS